MKIQRRSALVAAAVGMLAAGGALAQSSMTFGSPAADPATVYVTPSSSSSPIIAAPVVSEPVAGRTRVWVDGMPHDVYYDEMGRRYEADTHPRVMRFDLTGTHWETVDAQNGGATPAQVSQMTGKVDSSTSGVPKSGSGVQPGNMGPANSKGQ